MPVRRIAWTLGFTLIFLATSALGGAAGAQAKKGYLTQVVSSTHLHNGICTVAVLPQPAYGNIPPAIPLNPTKADLVWTPGFNDQRCKALPSRGNTKTASALAQDIDKAPADAKAAGEFCLNDNGTRVFLYFDYPGKTVGPVIVQLLGCGWVYTAGSEMRVVTTQLRFDLRPLAPSPWRRYLDPYLFSQSTK
jgi:hypothetical protein